MAADVLPPSYRPYSKLAFCSNVFENVAIPLAINEQPLVLIGQGTIPLIWLAAPSLPGSSTWVFVVKESKAVNPGILVESSVDRREVSVKVGPVIVLMVKANGAGSATVSALDLRPLGLVVTGTDQQLKIGTNTFAQGGIKDARVGINLSVPSAQLVST